MTKMNKKRLWLCLLPAFIFLCGLALLLYPFISNWQYEADVRHQKQDFEELLTAPEDSAAFEKLYAELKRRNERLYVDKQKDLKDPFSYEQPNIDLTAYGLDGNTIGFLSIPKMDVLLPILLGANTDNMLKGAVHLTETSYPIAGDNTNSVIAAHRGYSRADMFRNIERLEIGDEIYIKNFRETLVYKVTECKIISPTDVKELLIQEGRDLVTLITCHPYGYNYQRYIVFCERASS